MANIDRRLITGYIESNKEKLEKLVDDLYELPIDYSTEKNAFNLICKFLEQEGFTVNKHIENIENTFIANYGKGNKKVAFICEFEPSEYGYTNGHNIQCAMNIGAALGLKRIVDNLDCQILIYGFPKEEKTPLKMSFERRHLFNGINLVICGHPGEKTYETVNSMAMSIIKFEFLGKEANFNLNPNEGISSLNPMIKFLDIVQDLKCNFNPSYIINYTLENDHENIFRISGKSSCIIAIKAYDNNVLEEIKDKIIESSKFTSKLYCCDVNFNIIEEYMPLNKNIDLIKRVCHNLKECGIINIHGPFSTALSLDIGSLSQKIPVIHPYIGISENNEKYGTIEFKNATIKKYAKDMMIKSACALALTAFDTI